MKSQGEFVSEVFAGFLYSTSLFSELSQIICECVGEQLVDFNG